MSTQPPARPAVRSSPAAAQPGLPVRFVTRMSRDLDEAVKTAARREGITAGAWARRTLLERVGLQSPADERSGRPLVPADEELADIATAIRELGGATVALSLDDRAGVRNRIEAARALLIPIAVRRNRK